MNNDLISREALKKYARVVFDKDLGRLRVVDVSDIDNAPTVELFCSYLSDGEVREPCVEAPCEHERPQGEWKMIGTIGLAYKCDKCGEVNVIPTNFCPNCGADMQKGGAK